MPAVLNPMVTQSPDEEPHTEVFHHGVRFGRVFTHGAMPLEDLAAYRARFQRGYFHPDDGDRERAKILRDRFRRAAHVSVTGYYGANPDDTDTVHVYLDPARGDVPVFLCCVLSLARVERTLRVEGVVMESCWLEVAGAAALSKATVKASVERWILRNHPKAECTVDFHMNGHTGGDA